MFSASARALNFVAMANELIHIFADPRHSSKARPSSPIHLHFADSITLTIEIAVARFPAPSLSSVAGRTLKARDLTSASSLAALHKRLQPLVIKKMLLAAPPPRDNRFGQPGIGQGVLGPVRADRRDHLS